MSMDAEMRKKEREFLNFFENIDQIMSDITIRNKDELIEMLKAQLYSGERSDGSMIVPKYASNTIRQKKKLGHPTDRVTLLWKGDFYDSITATQNGSVITFDATDEKKSMLLSKYQRGDAKILDLNQDWLITFINEVVNPELIIIGKRIIEN